MSQAGLNFRVQVSNASKTDIPRFFEFASNWYEDRNELRGYNDLISEIKIYNSAEWQDKLLYFQIYSDDNLCGCAIAFQKDEVLLIPILVVDPNFREIGVADHLFSVILSSEEFKSASKFESQVLPGDRQGKNFFEQHAGKTRKLIVQGIIKDAITEQ